MGSGQLSKDAVRLCNSQTLIIHYVIGGEDNSQAIKVTIFAGYKTFCFFWHDSPQWARASSFTRFLDHIQRRTTFGRTPLDERSARRRHLYLTGQNTHSRQTSVPLVGFEPTISAGERQQTYVLDRMATGIGKKHFRAMKSR